MRPYRQHDGDTGASTPHIIHHHGEDRLHAASVQQPPEGLSISSLPGRHRIRMGG